MSARTTIALIVMALSAGLVETQVRTHVIIGQVVDSANGRPVRGVSVQLDNTVDRAQSDSVGHFSILSRYAARFRIWADDFFYDGIRFDSLTLQRTPCLGACPAFLMRGIS
ncbi:MAG: hypothetical protein IBJ03_10900 [Gemmatimonadaceae bacterium]|nr:hypothetical protein [Gemmatimonadaceae bacterium]